MSRLTIDEAGTVRLIDDDGTVVDAVRIDAAGRTVPAQAVEGVLDDAPGSGPAPSTEEPVTGIEGAVMLLLTVAAALTLPFVVAVILLWVRFS